jgi:hypothetical protein
MKPKKRQRKLLALYVIIGSAGVTFRYMLHVNYQWVNFTFV